MFEFDSLSIVNSRGAVSLVAARSCYIERGLLGRALEEFWAKKSGVGYHRQMDGTSYEVRFTDQVFLKLSTKTRAQQGITVGRLESTWITLNILGSIEEFARDENHTYNRSSSA